MKARKVVKRNEVEKQYKWAIFDIYANDQEWEKEYQTIVERLETVSSYKGTITQSAQNLYNFMCLNETVNQMFERVYMYANQRYHEDTSNATYQALLGRIMNLQVKVESVFSFEMPELLSAEPSVIQNYLEIMPELKKYENYLNQVLRLREHTLTKELEEIIASAREIMSGPETIYSMFDNADIKFPEILDEEGNAIRITHGSYGTLMESKNRSVREAAFRDMYDTYKQFKNTLAATFNAKVKSWIFESNARKYHSNMERALFNNNVPTSVYENLIEVVNENLELMHRYVSLRKKLLGLEELHMYDIYVPMVQDVEMEIPFEEGKKTVYNALECLGEDYQKALKQGYEEGWIDVYENEGKRSGAYSWGPYGTHPYVLLNYQDNLDNMFTLAHEMGHALHSYYSDKALPFFDAEYRIFVAEVASTCNEALLMEYMLKKTEDTMQRAYLINYFLDQFRTTLYRQTMFAEFEQITHAKAEAGESLTAELLCSIYLELNKKYYGSDMVSDLDISYEWEKVPHFYTPFYVYQYATGYSAAIAISRKILNEGAPAVDAYKKFLSGGSSKPPIELLKIAGVDISMKEPIQEALNLFKELLDEMEELMSK